MTEQLSRAVARELRRLLAERGLSGNQLAKETGISQPSIARKLRGTTSFTLDDLAVICPALEVEVADLMAGALRSDPFEVIVTSD